MVASIQCAGEAAVRTGVLRRSGRARRAARDGGGEHRGFRRATSRVGGIPSREFRRRATDGGFPAADRDRSDGDRRALDPSQHKLCGSQRLTGSGVRAPRVAGRAVLFANGPSAEAMVARPCRASSLATIYRARRCRWVPIRRVTLETPTDTLGLLLVARRSQSESLRAVSGPRSARLFVLPRARAHPLPEPLGGILGGGRAHLSELGRSRPSAAWWMAASAYLDVRLRTSSRPRPSA